MAKRPGSMSRYGNSASFTNEAMLEQENERQVDSLHSKVSMLKELTIDIGDEVRSQNSLLGDMDGSFDDTDSLLGISMRKVNKLASGSSGRLMCYLIGFAVTVFLFIWYLM
eukprot:TRINITY_DN3426_c0_g1_i1.p1 TRINITY_DN3426_c0_g1~~TRINITY_DN3426_c0_g1_i1.p1  ORF type:complete len:111 (+),score=9.51 TRINITY_DN3426_c0_g1_i1:83-415(+)